MATGSEYTEEQLNYYRICCITTDELTDGLRTIFKQEWDNRYATTLGEWKDEAKNGQDFKNGESPQNQASNRELLATMINGNRAEWDCSMLFYAILYSDCIGRGLNVVVRSNIDDLRKFRYQDFAHLPRGQISELKFQSAITKLQGVFQALGLSTVKIQEIRNQANFSISHLNKILKEVDKLKQEVKVLEEQLQSETTPFCILPPQPPRDVAARKDEVQQTLGPQHPGVATSYNSLATVLRDQGDLKQAKEYHERALAIMQQTLGPQHPNVATSYNNLATVLRGQGDLKQAKEYHERALAIRQQTLGPQHPDVATSYNNLATVLRGQGDLKQAKEYHERSLAIMQQTLGPQHPDIATSYNNLATVLRDQGELKEAKEYYECALAIMQQNLGPQHPNVATSYNNLATVLRDQGDLKQAKEYHERVLAIRQQTLGPQHPDVATSYNNLATVLRDQGDLKQAMEYHERALAIRQQTLGPQHPDVAIFYNNLAIVLRDQGDLKQAKEYHEHALAIMQQTLGPQHPDVATSYNNLATVLCDQGDLKQAKEYHERALAIMQQNLGPQHPNVATSYNNLATVLRDQGDLKQAKEYHERALAIRQQTLGPQHPDVATSYNNLATVLRDQGDLKEAMEYLECALAIRQQTLGPQHPDVATSYNNLAIVLRDQGDLKQAKEYHERVLAIRQETLGPQHPDVATSYNNLATVLRDQGDLKEAKEYYEFALAIMQQTLGAEHPDVATCYKNLATVLRDQGDLLEAKEYHERALAVRQETLGPQHPDVASSYKNLASILKYQASGAEADKTEIQGQGYYEQGNYDENSSGQTSETREEDLPHEIHKLQLKEEPDKVAIFEGTVTSEALHLDLNEGAIHLTFPPDSVAEPTDIMVYKWKYGACLPQLMEHEAVVSNVIEISAAPEVGGLKFNSEVKLVLSHNAAGLEGYEVVLKRLIDKEKYQWEETAGCDDIQQVSDIEDDHPCPNNVPYSFPVVRAGITECSLYVVVSRLKLSRKHTITVNGGTFSHPDYPEVKITVPQKAVATETRLSLGRKICGASMLLIAGWLFAHGSISWQSSLFIKGVALIVVALVVGFLTLLEGPFTVSQICRQCWILVQLYKNCSYLLVLIAGWLGAYGSTFWQPSLIIIAVVLTVIALVMDYLALYARPSTVSQKLHRSLLMRLFFFGTP
ncbi:uncharacterized protein LOC141886376 isoform X3 [Acropora palmata]|uniref:uncharacterized protein LOC141886376 isoform X3 n=1 Tax=Acropora palmata TaxID=6131 RepID=UPI003D9FF16A